MNMGTRVPSLEVTKTCVLSSLVEGSKSPLRTVLRKSVGSSGESRSILRVVERCQRDDLRGQWSVKREPGSPGREERSRPENCADDNAGKVGRKMRRTGSCTLEHETATHRNVAPGTVNDVTLKKASESLRLRLQEETETGPLHGSLISRWSSPELSFRCCSTLCTS